MSRCLESRPPSISRSVGTARLWLAVLTAGLLGLGACHGPQYCPTPEGVGPPTAEGVGPPTAEGVGPPMAEGVGPPMGPNGPILDNGYPSTPLVPAPPEMPQGVPLPYQPVGPWAPPGVERPWPADEYLRDGGVTGPGVAVRSDWTVVGMGMEDAVAHFDTVDGRTLVQPTNPVYLYAPRFAAVRAVTGVVVSEQWNAAGGVIQPTRAAGYAEVDAALSDHQNIQAGRQVGAKALVAARGRQFGGLVSAELGPRSFINGYQAFENVEVIRTGQMLEADMAVLARSSQAAVTWSTDESVSVLLNRRAAMETVKDRQVEAVYTVKAPPGNPKLRVIKVASTPFAKPGELVAFTIRFDNVGNQTIGNVTILDNLSSRLEFVPNTAQSSLPAQFSSKANDGGSLELRWEITPPLEVGKGGVIRFTSRVR